MFYGQHRGEFKIIVRVLQNFLEKVHQIKVVPQDIILTEAKVASKQRYRGTGMGSPTE